jgi:hypothetical protein
LLRSVVVIAAFGAQDRFASGFPVGYIWDRRQFGRPFLAMWQRHCKRRVDPHYSKAFPDEFEQCNENV